MDGSKPWYASKTIWGAIVLGVSTIAGLAGHAIAPDDQANLITAVTAIGDGVGVILTIVGRFRASKAVTLTK